MSHEGNSQTGPKKSPIAPGCHGIDSAVGRVLRPMVSHFLSAFWTGKTIG